MNGNVTALRAYAEAIDDDAVFEVWRTEMLAAGCRPRTVREREIMYRHYVRHIGKPAIEASRQDLMSWLSRPDLSPKTRQGYKSFLHTLYTTLQDAGLRADNPATRLPRSRVPRTEANPFTTAELERILAQPMYRRTRMMVLLAAYQGFRAVEIAAVAGDNIDWVERRIITREAKGGVEVWRPLHPMVWDLAQSFPREGWWFPGTKSRKGTHLKPSSVSNTVGQLIDRTGITGHRPHNLRAWFATELVEAGADLLTVQQAMRHASPATLRHYVRPSMGNIEKAMSALPIVATPSTPIASRASSGARGD
ncbi:tyrosine-type recombinase/integrase [Compostimonas suwonensis]|uniref:Integrase/recombinase XerD n=1 Tax=Compostimonas suwonensis TaxID=1048394 RepID=A0A2M9BW85_9MICO|nr:site-specific integrase [Compostimonas suwonensis]PJJ62174.1 integrase/recombinase XerD [Compostimonas suwonensis]